MILIKDIPDLYCDIIEAGSHKPKDDRLTVTELCNPPLIKYLQIEKWDEIKVRASEYLWMILGKAVHQVFESSGLVKQLQNIVKEYESLSSANQVYDSYINYVKTISELKEIIDSHFAEKPVEVIIKGQKIRGRIDFRETGIIRDFKVTSVWSFMKGIKPEWETQDNIYAFMSKRNGIPVEKLFIDAILRDWKIVETFRNPKYPKMPFISLEVPIWDEKKTYHYILERIAAYHSEPVECSAEEKWQKLTTWAVKKPKTKRATRVFNYEEEALQYIKEHKGKDLVYEIEKRTGECTRCLHYCVVRTVCPFSGLSKDTK